MRKDNKKQDGGKRKRGGEKIEGGKRECGTKQGGERRTQISSSWGRLPAGGVDAAVLSLS